MCVCVCVWGGGGGGGVNRKKSELAPKQDFDFVGYHFNLKEGKIKPILEHWQTLNAKIQKLLSIPTCPGTRVTRKGDPYPKVTPSSLKVLALGRKHYIPSVVFCKS